MAVNITADQIVNSNNEAFSFFFTDLQEGQGLVFNLENNRWENAFIQSAEEETTTTSSATSWAATAPAEEGMVPSELYDATFYGMNSLYFDGSSQLKRDFAAGNSSAWTSSFWIKKDVDMYCMFFWAGDASNPYKNDSNIALTSLGNFQVYSRNSSGTTIAQVTPSALYRESSAWYHIVTSFDATQSTSIKIYVDGKLLSEFDDDNYPTSALSFNTQIEHRIGGRNDSGPNCFAGRMANIQFIDGMALDAGYFGQNIEGIWAPKKYEGSYGANGFWLDFNKTQWDSVDDDGNPTATSILQTVEDVSGNGNHWQAA